MILSELDQLDFLKSFHSANSSLSELSQATEKKKSAEKFNQTDESNIINLQKVLILDTETTGLDPLHHKCLEVGSILFHVQSRAVLAQQSFLIPVENNEAESINRIPAEITKLAQPWRDALLYFNSLVDAADAIVAHNAAFDKQWFNRDPLPKISMVP